jgi:hypothetical protein
MGAAATSCTASAPFLASVAGLKAGYDFAGEITAGSSSALKAQCLVWRQERTAIDARLAAGTPSDQGSRSSSRLRPWLDQTCAPDAPPPADPAGAAIWLAGLIVRMHELTAAETP